MGHDNTPVDPDTEMKEDPDALPTVYIGFVGSLLTVIAILICAWVYYAVDETYVEETYERDLTEVLEYKASQGEKLKSIEAAKQAVIQRYNG